MRRATLILVLGLACFLAPMTAAYALWTASATGTMNVSTAFAPVTTAPTLSCVSSPSAGTYRMSFTNATHATSYTVYRSTTTNATASYTSLATNATSPYTTPSAPNGSTCFYRVKGVNSLGEGPFSNTLRVVRSSAGAMTCTAVTP